MRIYYNEIGEITYSEEFRAGPDGKDLATIGDHIVIDIKELDGHPLADFIIENEKLKLRTRDVIDERIQSERLKQTMEDRVFAYRTESDDLLNEYLYDGTPESEKIWKDKVKEIKERFPKP